MSQETERPAISELIARAINGAIALVKAEIEAYKATVKRKVVDSAVAIGLFAVVGILALLIVVFLFVAAYQALTLVFPGWLAALIIVAALAVLASIVVMIAVRLLKRTSVPPVSEPVKNVKDGITEGIRTARESDDETTAEPASEGISKS
ncbi:Putative Holin-X, holin superfamily III [Micrococcales bacterium KH10]|nr:Putative Holin-X, holin superfamily III [Micrococcales bacterium KH10]